MIFFLLVVLVSSEVYYQKFEYNTNCNIPIYEMKFGVCRFGFIGESCNTSYRNATIRTCDNCNGVNCIRTNIRSIGECVNDEKYSCNSLNIKNGVSYDTFENEQCQNITRVPITQRFITECYSRERFECENKKVIYYIYDDVSCNKLKSKNVVEFDTCIQNNQGTYYKFYSCENQKSNSSNQFMFIHTLIILFITHIF